MCCSPYPCVCSALGRVKLSHINIYVKQRRGRNFFNLIRTHPTAYLFASKYAVDCVRYSILKIVVNDDLIVLIYRYAVGVLDLFHNLLKLKLNIDG